MKTLPDSGGREAQGAGGNLSARTLRIAGVRGEESVEQEGFADWEEGEVGSPGLG